LGENGLTLFWRVIGVIGLMAGSLSCRSPSPIVVTPPNQFLGQVEDAFAQPVEDAEVFLYSYVESEPDRVLHSGLSRQDGIFRLIFPRHKTYSSEFLLVAPEVEEDFPLYGFAIGANSKVDMVSTLVYELISYSRAPLDAFTSADLFALSNQVRKRIQKNVEKGLIDLKAEGLTAVELRRAYRNAIAADQDLMADFRLRALEKGYNLFSYVPFQEPNSIPSIVDNSPSILTPSVSEGNILNLSIAAIDYDRDRLFYAWFLEGKLIGQDESAFEFTPDYDLVPYDKMYLKFELKAIASDGGLFSERTWTVIVQNTPRPPVFTSKPSTVAGEDVLWKYQIAAYSPDGAPFEMTLLDNSFPSGADLCLRNEMLWQVSGEPCQKANEIQWVPNNCQTTSWQTFQVEARDVTNTVAYHVFSVNASEVNDPPSITSLPPGHPTPQAVEAYLWNYQVSVFDPQVNPALFSDIDGLNLTDHSTPDHPDHPYYYEPGGRGCSDPIRFQLLQAPPSAEIDADTGLISWIPEDNETGNQTFRVRVTDGRGGEDIQNFTVYAADENQAPEILTPVDGTVLTVLLDELLAEDSEVSFQFSLQADDPDRPDPPSLEISGLPPGMSSVKTNNRNWSFTWWAEDSHAPSSHTVDFTLCDTNPKNGPLSDLVPAGVYVGSGGTTFCLDRQITIEVPKRNIQARFTSTPVSIARGDEAYEYEVRVVDRNTDPPDNLTFTLLQAPAGMTITPISTVAPNGSALIEWSPSNVSDLGFHTIKIQVQDDNPHPPAANSTNVQEFMLFVAEQNLPPTFTSTPLLDATNGELYEYQVTATDPNITSPNNRLTYSLSQHPSGMQIDPKTGLIHWIPSVGQAQQGSVDVTVVVKDGGNPQHSDEQSFQISITYVNVPPEWDLVPDQIIGVNNLFELNVSSYDADGDPLMLWVDNLPLGANFEDNGDGTGVFSWSPLDPIVVDITFWVEDDPQKPDPTIAPHQISQVVRFKVIDEPYFLSTPVRSATVGEPYAYEVHLIDPVGDGLTLEFDLAPYGVSIDPHDSGTSFTLRWSPDSGQNGLQLIILRAYDANGKTSTQECSVSVKANSNTKPIIQETFPDGSVPIRLTERKNGFFSLNAIDPDVGDNLHYSWYWSGVWQGDGSNEFTFWPQDHDSGDGELEARVTDGASIVSYVFDVRVRDAVPRLGRSYNLGSDQVSAFVSMPEAEQWVVTTNTGKVHLFEKASFEVGPIATVGGVGWSPERVVVRNDFASPTYYQIHLASKGTVGASGNLYRRGFSEPLATSNCTAAVCAPTVFRANYPQYGGTRIVFSQSLNRYFYIDPGNAEQLRVGSIGAAPHQTVALGAGVTAKSLSWNSASKRVFVTDHSNGEVIVVDGDTLSILNRISLPPGETPFEILSNPLKGLMYSVNFLSGAISEIATAQMTHLQTIGAGVSPYIGAPSHPNGWAVINPEDELIYLIHPDHHELVVIDTYFGTSKVLNLGSQRPEAIFYSPGMQRAILSTSGPSSVLYEIH
jgi:hypothetical protein